MDNKTIGAWLVHHTHKLATVQDTGQFGRIRLAGKCGILLSALSTSNDTSIDQKQVNALAQAASIDATFELGPVLDRLVEHHLVERHKNGIEVIGLTTPVVLEHASDIFKSLDYTPEEVASIRLAEVCSATPHEKAELQELLSDKHKLTDRKAEELLQTSEEIGFTDAEDVDSTTRLYFNGNLFRSGEIKKVQAVLASLSSNDMTKVQEANELLRVCGCTTSTNLENILGSLLFKKLQSIGMYDVSVVSNATESIAFVTKPSAFSKYGSASDAFDNAKALIAAISYGINRSHPGRGRITMVDRLLRKLIAGSSVGPATAIGEDYKILELKHVIQVTREGHSYSMRLLKKEVGELALQVLTDGDASEQSLPSFPGASVTQFRPPEEQRTLVRRRKKQLSGTQLSDVLLSLRSGRGAT